MPPPAPDAPEIYRMGPLPWMEFVGKHSPLARQTLTAILTTITGPTTKKSADGKWMAEVGGIFDGAMGGKFSADSAMAAVRLYLAGTAVVVTGAKLAAVRGFEIGDDLPGIFTGDIFRREGIENFPFAGHETSSFSGAETRLATAFAPMLAALSAAERSPLSSDIHRPVDAFKAMVHALLPRKTRQRLGEFYTPDWLAEFTLDRLGDAHLAGGRLLDPACGSGTFLVAVLRRLLADAKSRGQSNVEIVADMKRGMAGFDVQPGAVVAARANWLLAALPMLPAIAEPITIPVFLRDVVAEFDAPAIPDNERFDTIAGNPPWIQWEQLPALVRQQTARAWRHFGLFVHGGMDAILGKGKKDFSLLLTVAALDRWLKPGGKMAVVIPQLAWKNSGAAQGFRRFLLPDRTPVAVRRVDDFSRLQVFEGASTRPTVFLAEKGTPTAFPVPYAVWAPADAAASATVASDANLADVTATTRRIDWVAEPISHADATSPWLAARPVTLRALRKILGASDYHAHEGVNTGGANGVFWLEILGRESQGFVRVRNITDGAKRHVAGVEAAIEADLVRPLIRPRDVRPWIAAPSAHILFVQDPHTRRGIALETMRQKYPAALAYLSRFETALRERAAFARYFLRRRKNGTQTQTGAFYSMFNVGEYTLAPAKAIWTRLGNALHAAAVVDADFLMQETITFVPARSPAEAHFIAAVVNSAPFQLAAHAGLASGGKSFGSPHMVQQIRIPTFDATNATHARLADLAAKLHATPPAGKAADIADIHTASAKLWTLTAAEMAAIRRDLAEWVRQ